jgi:tRNA nucleotidyltransferase (CCA-adding enzyme)
MCVSTYNVQQDLVLKLTMFLHDIGKPLCYTETFNDELNKNIGHFYGHAKISSEIVEVILRRLKYDNDTIRNVVQLVFYHDILFINTETYIKKLLNKISEKTFRQLIKVRIADIEAQNPIYSDERINKVLEVEKTLNKVISEQQCFCLKELTINGDILIEIGFKGVEIGNILKDILDKVINDELNNIEEDLILYAKNIYFQKKY